MVADETSKTEETGRKKEGKNGKIRRKKAVLLLLLFFANLLKRFWVNVFLLHIV